MEPNSLNQSDAWHEAVCSALVKIRWRVGAGIRRFRIIPLSDGTWSSSTSNLFFDLKVAGIPSGLGFRTLKAGVKKNSARYTLFETLGVKPASAAFIAEKDSGIT